jgi:hypothetical protein
MPYSPVQVPPIDAPFAIAVTIALAPASYRMQNFTAAHERQGA